MKAKVTSGQIGDGEVINLLLPPNKFTGLGWDAHFCGKQEPCNVTITLDDAAYSYSIAEIAVTFTKCEPYPLRVYGLTFLEFSSGDKKSQFAPGELLAAESNQGDKVTLLFFMDLPIQDGGKLMISYHNDNQYRPCLSDVQIVPDNLQICPLRDITPTKSPTTLHPTFVPTDVPTTSLPTADPTTSPTESPTESPTTASPTEPPTNSYQCPMQWNVDKAMRILCQQNCKDYQGGSCVDSIQISTQGMAYTDTIQAITITFSKCDVDVKDSEPDIKSIVFQTRDDVSDTFSFGPYKFDAVPDSKQEVGGVVWYDYYSVTKTFVFNDGLDITADDGVEFSELKIVYNADYEKLPIMSDVKIHLSTGEVCLFYD